MRTRCPLFLAAIAGSTLLSACGPDRTAYDSAMGCVVNEVAFHHFIDQNYDSGTMMTEDRKRVEILRSRAVRAGQALGIPPERTYGDTWQAAWKIIAQDRKEDSLQEVMRARACLPQPSGSTHP